MSVFTLDKLVGFGAADGFKILCIPFDVLSGSQRDIAEQGCFGQCARVVEIARGRPARLAGFDPFTVVTDGIRNERIRRLEIDKFLLR